MSFKIGDIIEINQVPYKVLDTPEDGIILKISHRDVKRLKIDGNPTNKLLLQTPFNDFLTCQENISYASLSKQNARNFDWKRFNKSPKAPSWARNYFEHCRYQENQEAKNVCVNYAFDCKFPLYKSIEKKDKLYVNGPSIVLLSDDGSTKVWGYVGLPANMPNLNFLTDIDTKIIAIECYQENVIVLTALGTIRYFDRNEERDNSILNNMILQENKRVIDMTICDSRYILLLEDQTIIWLSLGPNNNNTRGIDLELLRPVNHDLDYGILYYGKIDQEIKQIKTRNWGTLFLLTNGDLKLSEHEERNIFNAQRATNIVPELYKKCFFIYNFGEGFLAILENHKAKHICNSSNMIDEIKLSINFENVIKISCGRRRTNFVLLLRDGTVRVYSRYDDESLQPNEETQQILDSNNVVDVAIGDYFVVARLSSGKLVVWGPSAYHFDPNTTSYPVILTI